MIFRQLFDSVSSTYTYLIASRSGGEALLIDPVFEKTDRYIKLMQELDLKLVKVIDTHVHADHITAMGALRDVTNCVTVMGKESPTDVVSCGLVMMKKSPSKALIFGRCTPLVILMTVILSVWMIVSLPAIHY